jgi:hypothetical protein
VKIKMQKVPETAILVSEYLMETDVEEDVNLSK